MIAPWSYGTDVHSSCAADIEMCALRQGLKSNLPLLQILTAKLDGLCNIQIIKKCCCENANLRRCIVGCVCVTYGPAISSVIENFSILRTKDDCVWQKCTMTRIINQFLFLHLVNRVENIFCTIFMLGKLNYEWLNIV